MSKKEPIDTRELQYDDKDVKPKRKSKKPKEPVDNDLQTWFEIIMNGWTKR